MDLQKPAVSIIGAGPAGFALAADLQSRGTPVLMYTHPSHPGHAAAVAQHNNTLVTTGLFQSTTRIRITTSISEALAFSPLLVLTVPSTGQETILSALGPFYLGDHIIIAIPGNLFSLISQHLNAAYILETNLSPYSCRMTANRVTIMGKKQTLTIAPLSRLSPPSRISSDPSIHQTIQTTIFPGTSLKWCASVLQVSLDNINGIFHPAMMLLNAGRVESPASDFLLYREGLTRSVANTMEALDRVRVRIGDALGFDLQRAIDVSNECYGQAFTDYVRLARESPPHRDLRAPDSMANRNISEDVPDLLVCWFGLAEKLGVDAAPIGAIITLAGMATGVDYFEGGRNLRKLNLDKMSRAELIARFGKGSIRSFYL
ncbi:6-phosphogluconate dehydrogenase C-terminal domain-like protein [Echria macrotheca]|uniref:6-phosphogluconate dehydrogenase C-terminal domain-like protein n=1 Tax=Echria macrotheca TaxID=438768 RepID=A0AAJ0BDQ2_9PEZI|nr:6-phosphogluconate dehydrogenase C-terminal domain-like protein [Echria macrotheca]